MLLTLRMSKPQKNKAREENKTRNKQKFFESRQFVKSLISTIENKEKRKETKRLETDEIFGSHIVKSDFMPNELNL